MITETATKTLTTTREIMDSLGGNKGVASLTGRTTKCVSNWRAFNRFPPDTYVALQTALAKAGFGAPDSLWRMAEPTASHNITALP